MLRSSISAFLVKQKGKSFGLVCAELSIRVVSILLLPVIYLMLMVFSLIKPVKLGFLYHERLGHLALNTDLYLRRRYLGLIPKNELHIFFVYSPANQQLVRMFAREIILIDSEFLAKLFAPIGVFRTRYWEPLPFVGNEYYEFHNAPPQISFTEEEHVAGRALLEGMGITKDQWYVCIFARDHRYYEVFSPNTDAAFSDHRNADIESYKLAAQAIVEAGGWILRMGSCVDKAFMMDHPRVIDYASLCRSDFSDIYITAHARFFVGTTSGASDLAVLFNVPFVGVNWVPIGYSPFGKGSIYIPKHLVEATSEKEVPITEQLAHFVGNQISVSINPDRLLMDLKWKFKDNTPEEIRDVALEMLERLSGDFSNSAAYQASLAWYANAMPLTNIYRNTRSTIGKRMLEHLEANSQSIYER